jgi:hypothetical protein
MLSNVVSERNFCQDIENQNAGKQNGAKAARKAKIGSDATDLNSKNSSDNFILCVPDRSRTYASASGGQRSIH